MGVRENTPQKVEDTERLHHYWTAGPGLAQWVTSPTPWRTFRALLLRFMNLDEATRVAAQWYHDALGYWPNSKEARIAQGRET